MKKHTHTHTHAPTGEDTYTTHAMLGKFLERVSRFGPDSISPAQVATAVVSAARCGLREEEAVRRLASTAAEMLASEVLVQL
jgi:hypothetical protein